MIKKALPIIFLIVLLIQGASGQNLEFRVKEGDEAFYNFYSYTAQVAGFVNTSYIPPLPPSKIRIMIQNVSSSEGNVRATVETGAGESLFSTGTIQMHYPSDDSLIEGCLALSSQFYTSGQWVLPTNKIKEGCTLSLLLEDMLKKNEIVPSLGIEATIDRFSEDKENSFETTVSLYSYLISYPSSTR